MKQIIAQNSNKSIIIIIIFITLLLYCIVKKVDNARPGEVRLACEAALQPASPKTLARLTADDPSTTIPTNSLEQEKRETVLRQKESEQPRTMKKSIGPALKNPPIPHHRIHGHLDSSI